MRFSISGAHRDTGERIDLVVAAADEAAAREVAYGRGIVIASVQPVRRNWMLMTGIAAGVLAVLGWLTPLAQVSGVPVIVLAFVLGWVVLLVATTRRGARGRAVAPMAMLHLLFAAAFTAAAGVLLAICLLGIGMSGFSGGPSKETEAIAKMAGIGLIVGVVWLTCSLVALGMRRKKPRASLFVPVLPCIGAAVCVVMLVTGPLMLRVGFATVVVLPLIVTATAAGLRWEKLGR